MTRIISGLLGLALAAGCTPSDPATPELNTLATPPEVIAADACWHKETVDEVTKVEIDRRVIAPETRTTDGFILTEEKVEITEREIVVTPASEFWFERVCDSDITPEFVTTLQRALQARDLLKTSPTGNFGEQTRAAIETYQTSIGLASDVLALETAKRLGLIAQPPVS